MGGDLHSSSKPGLRTAQGTGLRKWKNAGGVEELCRKMEWVTTNNSRRFQLLICD
jgi:hypothetical protein